MDSIFQSDRSTITTRSATSRATRWATFNLTEVRLRQWQMVNSSTYSSTFQSCRGAITTTQRLRKSWSDFISFNPTEVHYDKLNGLSAPGLNTFQSHRSPITTLVRAHLEALATALSILLRSDYDRSKTKSPRRGPRLSILLRSDYDRRVVGRASSSRSPFNPTEVRLRPASSSQWPRNPRTFQSY